MEEKLKKFFASLDQGTHHLMMLFFFVLALWLLHHIDFTSSGDSLSAQIQSVHKSVETASLEKGAVEKELKKLHRVLNTTKN